MQLRFVCIAVLFVILNVQAQKSKTIIVKNSLFVDRFYETVEVKIADLNINLKNANHIEVLEEKSKKNLTTQLVDTDGDGVNDVLLFQVDIKANQTKKYTINALNQASQSKDTVYCYSRFVPERTDDYAWENDKVAFRTFGPNAQYRFENKLKEATLSSGIDAWLKRVNYPIINKWYKKAENKIGAYHYDDGEGLDNFHVGVSRGIGGIAVKSDGKYYISKNFTAYKTITTGPIRTSFSLTYADWDANGKLIKETKHITLDYGSNLSKFEIQISGSETIHAGITLHKKEGQNSENAELGWISYWEPLDDSELGMGIVVPNKKLVATQLYDTTQKDESNYFAEIKVSDHKAVYYAGFGWKKSNQFQTKQEWENYLTNFSLKVNNPLKIQIR